jgi:predicted methyltransferase
MVKKMLRHKRIENTMKYIQMIHFGDKDFEVTTATTADEIKKLGTPGGVKYAEMMINGITMHFYKSQRGFSNV